MLARTGVDEQHERFLGNLGLTELDEDAIVSFLKTLTDEAPAR
jgi:hypothetical protein